MTVSYGCSGQNFFATYVNREDLHREIVDRKNSKIVSINHLNNCLKTARQRMIIQVILT